MGRFGGTGVLKAKACFFRLEDCVSIFFLFSGGRVAGSASSFDSDSPPELPVFSSEDSSSSSNSGEGSFVFFLALLLCEDGSELVVLVSESFSVFFIFVAAGVAAGAVVGGISTFATSVASSFIGSYGRGVFNSTSIFSFYGVAAGD